MSHSNTGEDQANYIQNCKWKNPEKIQAPEI